MIGYIQGRVRELTDRREKLEVTFSSSSITDPRTGIERIRKEISDFQIQMDVAAKESQQIMSEIHVWNGKLSESKTIEHNLSILH